MTNIASVAALATVALAVRPLPAGVSIKMYRHSNTDRMAVIVDEHNNVRSEAAGFGTTDDEAKANATAKYFATLYDNRSDSKFGGTVWVRRDGHDSKRVNPADLATYLADGWLEGKGKTGPRGPNARTLAKAAAAPAVEVQAQA